MNVLDYQVRYIPNGSAPIHVLERAKRKILNGTTDLDESRKDGILTRYGDVNCYTAAGYVLHLAEEHENSLYAPEYLVWKQTKERLSEIHQNPRYRQAVFEPLDNPKITDEQFGEWAFREAVRDEFGQSLEEVIGEALGVPVKGGKAVVDVTI